MEIAGSFAFRRNPSDISKSCARNAAGECNPEGNSVRPNRKLGEDFLCAVKFVSDTALALVNQGFEDNGDVFGDVVGDGAEGEDRVGRNGAVTAAGVDFTHVDFSQPMTECIQKGGRFSHGGVHLPGMTDIEAEASFR